MSITPINLDDRTFADLVEAARQRIQQTSPNWTDFSPANPGMALVDVFAYLTEILQYRVNRVPDKLRVELLRMLGISLRAASPATVTLRLQFGPTPPKSIPRHTRFQSATGVTFSTVAEYPVESGSSHARRSRLPSRTRAQGDWGHLGCSRPDPSARQPCYRPRRHAGHRHNGWRRAPFTGQGRAP